MQILIFLILTFSFFFIILMKLLSFSKLITNSLQSHSNSRPFNLVHKSCFSVNLQFLCIHFMFTFSCRPMFISVFILRKVEKCPCNLFIAWFTRFRFSSSLTDAVYLSCTASPSFSLVLGFSGTSAHSSS